VENNLPATATKKNFGYRLKSALYWVRLKSAHFNLPGCALEISERGLRYGDPHIAGGQHRCIGVVNVVSKFRAGAHVRSACHVRAHVIGIRFAMSKFRAGTRFA